MAGERSPPLESAGTAARRTATADSVPDHDGRERTDFGHAVHSRHATQPGDVVSEIEWLARSQTRVEILRHVRESSTDVDGLLDGVEVHRTTLRRNLEELGEKNLVRHSPDRKTVTITTAGRLVVDAFEELMSATRMAGPLGAFVDLFPESLPIGPDELRSCRVIGPKQHCPDAPLSRLAELLGESTTLRAFVPVLGWFHGRLFADGLSAVTDTTLLTTTPAWESFRADHPTWAETLTVTGEGGLRLSKRDPGFGIYLFDDSVALAATDRTNRVHSVLETTEAGTAIVEWAETRFEELLGTAEPVPQVGG